MGKSALFLILFTVAYLAAAATGAIAFGNREFLFYLGVMAVLIVFVLIVHLRVGLTMATLWCLSLWGALHMAGGLVEVPETWPRGGDSPVLYNLRFWEGGVKYDQLIHAFGFGITTWVCWQGFKVAARRPDLAPGAGALLLCLAAGMGFGALNEVVEFAATLILPETNVGGYVNTGWDLVSNLTGCVAAVILIALGGSARTP